MFIYLFILVYELNLAVLREPSRMPRIESGSVTCNANVMPTILVLQSPRLLLNDKRIVVYLQLLSLYNYYSKDCKGIKDRKLHTLQAGIVV